jgi:hypothetical protein
MRPVNMRNPRQTSNTEHQTPNIECQKCMKGTSGNSKHPTPKAAC